MDGDQIRYWNGQSWTDQVQPVSPTPTSAADTIRRPGIESGPGLLPTLFDFKLRADRSATIKIARFVYVALSFASILLWLSLVLTAFVAAASTEFLEFVVIGVITLVVGAVLVAAFIAAVRVLLEFILANIRTAQHTALLLEYAQEQFQPSPDKCPRPRTPIGKMDTVDQGLS